MIDAGHRLNPESPEVRPFQVFTPSEAADAMRMTVSDLSKLIRSKRYAYFPRKPGGKPGDRGRGRWGLTADQIKAIIKGETRIPPDLNPQIPGKPVLSPVSPDGKSRLRKGNLRGSC